ETCVRVGEMAGNLLVRTIHDAHLAFHEAFKRRIAKAAGQREHVLDALFLDRPREQIAAADSSLGSRGRRRGRGRHGSHGSHGRAPHWAVIPAALTIWACFSMSALTKALKSLSGMKRVMTADFRNLSL